ncbi:MAG TPA: PKD domain-containing protein, partial [Chitinophagaceae bacterium]|nr:PKD domain-containing protein [Chitinophagaceae bacterium]
NLNQPFDFWFRVYLGRLDGSGADGIVFMLQPISTSVGSSGGGMGFSGVTPSVGIALDTWQNGEMNDPAFDHISIQTNGQVAHTADLAAPVPISALSDNVENGAWHTLRISWDPASRMLRAYFNGVLRVEARTDMVKDIFGNDPMVYWGFSGATGGSSNLQQFCTALDPKFTTNLNSLSLCYSGSPVGVSFQDQSESFAPIDSYSWDFGNGTTSTAPSPSTTYTSPGVYDVNMKIVGKDGCSNDTTIQIIVGSKPQAALEAADTCSGQPPRVLDRSQNEVGRITQWTWTVNGTAASAQQHPSLANLAPGTHALTLQVQSEYGCASDEASGSIRILPRPEIEAAFEDACRNETVSFTASQLDNETTITEWLWRLDNQTRTGDKDPEHRYTVPGTYPIFLRACASNGCWSDSLVRNLQIVESFAFAGNDTTVLKSVPFQLSGRGAGAFLWEPPIGLSDPNISNPQGVLEDDQTYYLTVTTPQGCVAKDTVQLTVFKGSSVYVPNAFTPNRDGRNDLLKPLYIGIRNLDFFRVYNRWGQPVFSSSNLSAGWDGTVGGQPAATGSFA